MELYEQIVLESLHALRQKREKIATQPKPRGLWSQLQEMMRDRDLAQIDVQIETLESVVTRVGVLRSMLGPAPEGSD